MLYTSISLSSNIFLLTWGHKHTLTWWVNQYYNLDDMSIKFVFASAARVLRHPPVLPDQALPLPGGLQDHWWVKGHQWTTAVAGQHPGMTFPIDHSCTWNIFWYNTSSIVHLSLISPYSKYNRLRLFNLFCSNLYIGLPINHLQISNMKVKCHMSQEQLQEEPGLEADDLYFITIVWFWIWNICSNKIKLDFGLLCLSYDCSVTIDISVHNWYFLVLAHSTARQLLLKSVICSF